MPVTGIYVTADEQITNYLSAALRTSLTDDNEPFEQEHLDLAESTVSSFLRRRFALPIVSPSSTPALRKCALALFHESVEMVTRRLNDDTAKAADDCRTYLDQLAKGEVALENEEDQIHIDASSQGESLMEFGDRIFTDDKEVDGNDTTRDNIGINPAFTGKGGSRV